MMRAGPLWSILAGWIQASMVISPDRRMDSMIVAAGFWVRMSVLPCTESEPSDRFTALGSLISRPSAAPHLDRPVTMGPLVELKS